MNVRQIKGNTWVLEGMEWIPFYRLEGGRCILLDTGLLGEREDLEQTLLDHGLTPAGILCSHAHVDHISAAGEVAKALGIDCVRLAAADHPLYASPENALPPWLPAAKNLPPAKEFTPNDDFTVIPLPGHTPGGSGLLFTAGNALFVGDTLFAGSIGRTDLPGGDYATLMESIRSRLLTLPDDLNAYPGHGPATTIGRERASNPYLQD